LKKGADLFKGITNVVHVLWQQSVVYKNWSTWWCNGSIWYWKSGNHNFFPQYLSNNATVKYNKSCTVIAALLLW